jgi:sterol 3beta-glucosyltransferase
MHITIIALGSSGDVLPFTTLGRGLVQSGHGVRMATMRTFEDAVRSGGMEFHAMHGDAAALLSSGPGLSLGEAGGNILKMWSGAMRSFGALARNFAQDLSGLLDVGPTDLILNQLPGGLYGYDLAEKLSIPMVMAGVIPMIRTRYLPMVAFPPAPSWLPGYNALTFRIAEQLVWQFFRPTINRWRVKTLGLSPQTFLGPFSRMQKERTIVINGFSQHVVPPPPDWGPHIHLTGYWYAQPSDWQPPNSLIEFINDGEAPIFVGFGSMPIRNPAATLQTILEATLEAGVRLVLHRGWGGLETASLPDSVYSVGFTDYGWLFPRMAAVVHHGGAGTTAYALRAGVPNLIVPFLFDQFFWGRRIAEIGVGPKPIPFKKLKAGRLAQAFSTLQSQSDLKEAATGLGRRLREEDGIAHAVRILENAAAR